MIVENLLILYVAASLLYFVDSLYLDLSSENYNFLYNPYLALITLVRFNYTFSLFLMKVFFC